MSKPFRTVAWMMTLVLTLGSVSALAEQPAAHKAFLRGGNAIAEALAASKTGEPPAAAALVIPPQSPVQMAMPQEKTNHHRAALWVGIAVTGTIAAYLVRRSVKNHQSVFGPKG